MWDERLEATGARLEATVGLLHGLQGSLGEEEGWSQVRGGGLGACGGAGGHHASMLAACCQGHKECPNPRPCWLWTHMVQPAGGQFSSDTHV